MLYFASLGKTHQDTNTIHCHMSDIRENLVDFFTLLFLGLTVSNSTKWLWSQFNGVSI